MLYWVIFIVVVIAIIILFIRINIVIEYLRNRENDHLVISVFVLHEKLKYKIEIPMMDVGKSGFKLRAYKKAKPGTGKAEEQKEKMSLESMYEKLKNLKDYYRENKELIWKIRCYLTGRLIIKDFDLKLEVGTGDAFYTALLTGLIWSAVGAVSSYIFNSIKTLKKSIKIKNNFMEKKFKTDFYCIFSIKTVHIIVVGLKFLLNHYLKKHKINKSIGGGISG